MSVARPIFTPPAERRSVLDRAHVGDIEGALGTVGSFDTGPRRTFGRRLATLLAIMGPGLVVMVADNDAGGLAVYSQAGQGYGPSLLWVLLLLAPVLFINQEMVARLGAVTGAGLARLIVERFGRRKTGVNETGSRSRSLLIAARHALDDPATAEHLRRRRPRIERLLSLLSHRYGARKCRYRGRQKAELQAAWTAALVNLNPICRKLATQPQ